MQEKCLTLYKVLKKKKATFCQNDGKLCHGTLQPAGDFVNTALPNPRENHDDCFQFLQTSKITCRGTQGVFALFLWGFAPPLKITFFQQYFQFREVDYKIKTTTSSLGQYLHIKAPFVFSLRFRNFSATTLTSGSISHNFAVADYG